MSTEQDNSGLYFIVGILVAVVAVLGFVMFGGSDAVQNIEPAAGIEKAVDETSSSFEINIDEDGVSGSSTTEQSE